MSRRSCTRRRTALSERRCRVRRRLLVRCRVTSPEEADDPVSALRLADERLYAQKHAKSSLRNRPHELLLQVLLEREPNLHSHTVGVAALAREVGRVLGLEGRDMDELYQAAQLHDIGKLAIPDVILHKPGPLDPDEWEFLRRHTLVGERILAVSPLLRRIGEIVRSTHERWDGGGYPDGLVGEEIPLAARIICACDAFDAMTRERPYKRAMSDEAALAELSRCAGTQFDPGSSPQSSDAFPPCVRTVDLARRRPRARSATRSPASTVDLSP